MYLRQNFWASCACWFGNVTLQECGMLSWFATSTNIDCQLAITSRDNSLSHNIYAKQLFQGWVWKREFTFFHWQQMNRMLEIGAQFANCYRTLASWPKFCFAFYFSQFYGFFFFRFTTFLDLWRRQPVAICTNLFIRTQMTGLFQIFVHISVAFIFGFCVVFLVILVLFFCFKRR